MTGKEIDIIKRIAHKIIFVLSTILTAYLFVQLADNFFTKFLFAMLALAFEMIKLYVFIVGKSEIKARKLFHGVSKIFVYSGLAFVSIMASAGFAMSTIQANSDRIEFDSLETSMLQSEYDEINKEISNKLALQSRTSEGLYVSLSDKVSDDISDLKNRRLELYSLLTNVGFVSTGGESVYDNLGSLIGVEGRSVITFIMFILVFMLEICLVLTASDITDVGNDKKRAEKTPERSPDKHPIIKYIESMFDVDNISKLKSNRRIVKEIGITNAKGEEYRKWLLTLEEKGKPIFTNENGSTSSLLDMESVISIVKRIAKEFGKTV